MERWWRDEGLLMRRDGGKEGSEGGDVGVVVGEVGGGRRGRRFREVMICKAAFAPQ